MTSLKKYLPWLYELAFLGFIFYWARLPLRDFDIWFHIKAGEYISTHGVTFIEPFSYAAAGRQWIIFEWGFQLFVYWLSLIGLWIIPPVIGIVTCILFVTLHRTLKLVGNVSTGTTLFLSFFFFSSTYEFYTARPHVIAYTFLAVHLYIILLFVLKKKQLLWLTPFLTLVWTNIHSTGFLSWGMLVAFGCVNFVQFFFKREIEYKKFAKTLFVFALINAAVTLLPPKIWRDYELLYTFFVNREFLGNFVAEWGSPTSQDNPLGVFLYYMLAGIATLGYTFAWFTDTKKHTLLAMVPFFVMGATGFTAARNVFPGIFGFVVILARVWNTVLPTLRKQWMKIMVWVLTIFVLVFYFRLLVMKRYTIRTTRYYYPVHAAEFAKKYLKGRMFNDYNYGGYMMYSVYPELQILIDGRAEVYLCCEMHDYIKLATQKRLDDASYLTFVNDFFSKNGINFAIIVTQKHNVMRRIARLLNTDPSWSLVFWDDDSQVFVKRDGVNNGILKKLETKAATPYLRNPFNPDNIDRALFEYERMDSIVKSARTSNALGYIYLRQEEYDKAIERFEDAITRDATFESPLMNLAELAVKDGDRTKAIDLYRKALSLADDRGLIYLRLGELLLSQSNTNTEEVKKLWKNGIDKTVDEDARQQLMDRLAKL